MRLNFSVKCFQSSSSLTPVLAGMPMECLWNYVLRAISLCNTILLQNPLCDPLPKQRPKAIHCSVACEVGSLVVFGFSLYLETYNTYFNQNELDSY